MKNYLKSIIIIIVLCVLIVVRFFSDETNLGWISFINVSALFFSMLSLYFQLYKAYKGKKKFAFFTGVCVVLAFLAVIVLVLLAVSVIRPNAKANDIILLFTLLFSLPIDFYVNTIGKLLFNQ